MTINKAQGQTLWVSGIDLTTQCFSHGQLYVALSHVTSKQNMFIFTHNQAEVFNVVYKKNILVCFYVYNIYIIKYIKIL